MWGICGDAQELTQNFRSVGTGLHVLSSLVQNCQHCGQKLKFRFRRLEIRIKRNGTENWTKRNGTNDVTKRNGTNDETRRNGTTDLKIKRNGTGTIKNSRMQGLVSTAPL